MTTGLTRRDFLKYTAAAGASMLLAQGCATNPVTGETQLMMLTEQDEISLDKMQSPFQFSSDYGIYKDAGLQAYLSSLGKTLTAHTHRPQMPYSFQCVNATYINAYAFPGGSIAVTRGILLKLKSEAELAALIGHELGHVNARHSAAQLSKGTLSSAILEGLAMAVATQDQTLGEITQALGGLGQGLLLARYSRDNEHEADALGNAYQVKAGYSSQGFVDLMTMLKSLNHEQPSSAELLFATHPMSDDRYQRAVERSQGIYGYSLNFTLGSERYMDNTARLRQEEKAILAMQDAESLMAQKTFEAAEQKLNQAISLSPDDYAAHMMMAQCLMAREKAEPALNYLERAQRIDPEEPGSRQLSGLVLVNLERYDRALEQFEAYERRLPGNPTILFLSGYSLEGMNRLNEAAEKYRLYLNQVTQGDYAEHAYDRLVKWGAL